MNPQIAALAAEISDAVDLIDPALSAERAAIRLRALADTLAVAPSIERRPLLVAAAATAIAALERLSSQALSQQSRNKDTTTT